MSSDRYVRVVLTVIALCLVWLCVMTTPSPLKAQRGAAPQGRGSMSAMLLGGTSIQPVVVVGWGTLDAQGRASVAMTGDAADNRSDPNVPVRVVGYPMPPKALDVRLEYTDLKPLPVGVASIKRTGEWEPIRTAVEPEPVRPRPGR
jgi:hypothetical protein